MMRDEQTREREARFQELFALADRVGVEHTARRTGLRYRRVGELLKTGVEWGVLDAFRVGILLESEDLFPPPDSNIARAWQTGRS